MQADNQLATYQVPKGIVDLNEVSKTLMDMMREVKQNPTLIPQAQCMAEIADRMIDIAATQVKQGQMITELIRTKTQNNF